MSIKYKVIGVAMGAISLVGLGGSAHAISVTPADTFVGLDLASPLPEGIYFLDAASIGGFRYGGDHVNGTAHASALNYNVPVLIWSTPWTLAGGRIEALAALPFAELGIDANGRSRLYGNGLYNPFVGLSWNFSFGNGFSVSYSPGVYLPMSGGSIDGAIQGYVLSHTGVAITNDLLNQPTFDQKLAFSYHQNGWNATALAEYGIVGDNVIPVAFLPKQFFFGDFFNYNLALTKTIGKWELGVVGYGSLDTTNTALTTLACPNNPAGVYLIRGATCGKTSQFALGGLVGYNFGPVITQLIVSSDVAIQGYSTRDTRATLHAIVPLWTAPTPHVVTAKY